MTNLLDKPNGDYHNRLLLFWLPTSLGISHLLHCIEFYFGTRSSPPKKMMGAPFVVFCSSAENLSYATELKGNRSVYLHVTSVMLHWRMTLISEVAQNVDQSGMQLKYLQTPQLRTGAA